jgi:hypothetical protein
MAYPLYQWLGASMMPVPLRDEGAIRVTFRGNSGVEAVADSLPIAGQRPTARSRITNGKRLHAKGVDQRTEAARRFRDLTMGFADQLGGLGRLNEAERSLVRSAASLTIMAEKLQAAAASGEAVDNEALTRVSNSQARVLATLRRGRPTPRSETPSLSADMASRPASPLPSATALPRTQESRPEAPGGRAHED